MPAQPKYLVWRFKPMRNLLSVLLLLMLLAPAVGSAQMPLVKAGQIDAWRNAQTDSVYLINFWATWCVPCVEELPDVLRLQEAYAAAGVKLVLVCNDFKKNLTSRVEPFVREHGIQPWAVFMDEATPNKWIDTVSPEWSGGIPATWIVSPATGKEAFHEGKMSYREMEALLLSVLEH